MLYPNQTFVRARFLAGSLGGVSSASNKDISNRFISNALAFGPKTSVPQGYTKLASGITPTLNTSGDISARSTSEYSQTANLTAFGNLEFSAQANFTMSAFANVLSNGYSTMSFSFSFTSSIKARGNLTAKIDWAARPSAYDIAQEVWQAKASTLTTVGTMGAALNNAGGAGNPWSSLIASNNAPGTFGEWIQSLPAATRAELMADLTKVDELHKLQGLDDANPMTVTPTSRVSGSINLAISGDGTTTTTVTRT